MTIKDAADLFIVEGEEARRSSITSRRRLRTR